MTTIYLIFGTYNVRPFTNVDPDVTGYDVYTEDDERIGSLICDHYDLDHEENLEEFVRELEDWLMDNE